MLAAAAMLVPAIMSAGATLVASATVARGGARRRDVRDFQRGG
jgi:hypothetical protein